MTTVTWNKIVAKPKERTIENMNNSIITQWILDYATSLIEQKIGKPTLKTYTSTVYDYLIQYQNKIHEEDDIEQIKTDILQQRENTKERKEFVKINRIVQFLQLILQKQGKPPIIKKRPHRTNNHKKTISNSEIVNQFYKERNIQNTTIKGYESAFNQYLHSQNTTSIDTLLQEALQEQKDKVPLPDTKLKQRLITFRQYLIDQELSTHTIKTHFSKVKSFYRHMDVMLPHIKETKLEKPYVSNYDDLPTREELIRAVELAEPVMKAFLLFQISSGQARAEARSITVGQFVKACGEYCDDNLSLQDKVEQLSCRDDVVPVFYLRRLKTDKWYYTCCSPEAVYYICEYLKQRTVYGGDDPLFDCSNNSILVKYKRLNDELGMGCVGYYRKLRSHAMRKYHATKLPLSPEQVDMLQGRSRNEVHEAYIKINPKRVKQMYMEVMEYVMLYPEKWMKSSSVECKESGRVSVEVVSDSTNNVPLVNDNQQIIVPQQMVDTNLYKEIGKLELRIEMLEKELKELKGGI